MNRVGTSRGETGGERAAPVEAGRERMAYWRPSPALAPFVSGYHFYAVDPPAGERHRDVFQPAWFSLRVLRTPATDWTVRVGRGRSQAVPPVALFGPSSAVTWSESDAGEVVGAGLTPLGWMRLTRIAAADWADRVDDPATVFGTDLAQLARDLRASPPEQAPALFDRFLAPLLDRPARAEDRVATMTEALLDPTVQSVRQLAMQVSATERTIERLAQRAFGFAPKLLLRRSRFLRSLHAMWDTDRGERALAIDPGYTDYSHFVREAHAFLGMTPGRFMRIGTPMLARSFALRRERLGSPAQALLDGRPGKR
ncbi:helix-turn-helix domain-containing protein [Novosphingobium huizhouense]|uniref:helix-turn-helix domain-containing protein n=1 Tax=Novosphingobium huizhouense TaxID=2866625 RepID=UPI001CD914EC|nr:helix-turn-helix domain-containing protein [Novosphingobium huizhouense]